MEIGRRLAANMKRLRREKGWSQEELGERSGLHRTYISQVERVVKSPTIPVVEKIATALGVGVGDLVD
jgi:transcriptional regulator with XRE-family HTH domain